MKDEQSGPEVSDEFYCVEIVNINDVVERREERGLSHCTTLPTVTCSSVENIILSSSDQLNREIVPIQSHSYILPWWRFGDVTK